MPLHFSSPSYATVTGSDLKKLTEGKLGIGGGGEFRISECDIERDTEKESGWPGGGVGSRNQSLFLQKERRECQCSV